MNTPETDKRVWSDHSEGILYQVVEASFARKLERERDEARDIVEKLSKHGLEMMDENRSLKRERDEARKEIDRYREKLDLLPISWDV